MPVLPLIENAPVFCPVHGAARYRTPYSSTSISRAPRRGAAPFRAGALPCREAGIVSRENTFDAQNVNHVRRRSAPKRLESCAHQLNDRPPVVAIHHKRWTSIRLAVNNAIRIRHCFQDYAMTQRLPRSSSCHQSPSIGSSEFDSISRSEISDRAPQRPAQWPVPIVPNEHDTGRRIRALGDIATVYPRMAGLPSTEAFRGHTCRILHSINLTRSPCTFLALQATMIRYLSFLAGAAAGVLLQGAP